MTKSRAHYPAFLFSKVNTQKNKHRYTRVCWQTKLTMGDVTWLELEYLWVGDF